MTELIRQIDFWILELIQTNLRSPFTDAFMTSVTTLGDFGLIWLVLAVILLFIKQKRHYGILLILTLICTYISVDMILKEIVGRPRPFIGNEDITLLIQAPGGYSFPSGHTATAFAAAFISLRSNKKLGAAAYILAALIGFSRVYLYVHHPSDILVGALLGTAVSLLLWLPYNRLFIRGKNVK